MHSSKTTGILLFMLTLTFGVLLSGGYLMHKEKAADSPICSVSRWAFVCSPLYKHARGRVPDYGPSD